jgi:predicted dehydrogenase
MDGRVAAGQGSSRPLRAAVVGVGYLGRYHAEKYAAHPDAELVAVVDIDGGRAREVAAELGVEAVTDLGQLAGRIDCASVSVPTKHHFAVARDLLAAGVDVLVEKPLTGTVEEGKALVELAVRHGRVLQVGHLERFNPAVLAIDGLVTQPRFIECHRLAPFTERGTDVDVVLDLMIHDLDVILSMVPSALRSVEAVGVPVLTPSVDIANARLRFANGCIANVTASRVSLKRERKLRIFQADAYLSVDYGERRVRLCRREPAEDGQPALVIEDREVPEGDALESEIGAFLRAVREREPPPVSGWDGLRALEVVQIIRESLEAEVRAAQAASGAPR